MARRVRGPLRLILSGLSILFVRCTALLPLPLARLLGRCLGRVAYWCVPRIRRVGLANLDLAFGDSISPEEKRRILRGAAENIGVTAAEFGHGRRLAGEGAEDLVRIEGIEHIGQDRGVVLIGAHFGNWEWMGPALRRIGLDIAVVYRPLDEPWLDGFIAKRRSACGVEPVPKSEAGRALLRHLRAGWCVGILIDQSPRDNAVPITFFGERTWATAAPVLLALRAKAPIHLAMMLRDASGAYTLKIEPEIELRRTGDTRADLVENSRRCHAALETYIREHPDHWLWFHRRWKKRPHLEEAWAARRKPGNG